MKTWVLDASVAVAWYLPEQFKAAARQWQQRLLDEEIRLLIPSLHYWELGNVLRTYVRRREIDEDLAREIYSLHLDARLNLAEPDRVFVFETALKYEAAIYDAVYIALALEHGVPLVTAERSTTPWVVKLGKRAVAIGGS